MHEYINNIFLYSTAHASYLFSASGVVIMASCKLKRKRITLLFIMFLLLAVVMLFALWSCKRNSPCINVQASNLQRLAMVWGFAKYTHPAFLTGQLCWDDELLALIPIVRYAYANDVNNILYTWFVGLGDDGFDDNRSVFLFAPMYEFEVYDYEYGYGCERMQFYMNFITRMNKSDWVSMVGTIMGPNDAFIVALRVDENYLNAMCKEDELFDWLRGLTPMDNNYFLSVANLDKFNDVSFFGDDLISNVFSRFVETPMINREQAPVSFATGHGFISFSNQSLHIDMDFTNDGYRLLGLFRLWNAMLYYFPYLDIIDECWNALLFSHILMMLEGNDRTSYELVLRSLASSLRDAHIVFSTTNHLIESTLYIGQPMNTFDNVFGSFAIPVRLTEAEGYIVVADAHPNLAIHKGDVVLSVNGICINEIVSDVLQFMPYPTKEKALFYFTIYHGWLRQHSNELPMQLNVLRYDLEKSIEVNVAKIDTFRWDFLELGPTVPYEQLANNIGLINPALIYEDIHANAMLYLKDTNGLIIDLRQYPNIMGMWGLMSNFVEAGIPVALFSQPSESIPGQFVKSTRHYTDRFIAYGDKHSNYLRKIVVLMNEHTVSAGELTVMILQTAANVTVMGSNSIGANGNVQNLPLPGGIIMRYSTIGVFTPEGGQTQRIGLSPSINIPRTIAGVREGRDELLEAAINFLSR